MVEPLAETIARREVDQSLTVELGQGHRRTLSQPVVGGGGQPISSSATTVEVNRSGTGPGSTMTSTSPDRCAVI